MKRLVKTFALLLAVSCAVIGFSSSMAFAATTPYKFGTALPSSFTDQMSSSSASYVSRGRSGTPTAYSWSYDWNSKTLTVSDEVDAKVIDENIYSKSEELQKAAKNDLANGNIETAAPEIVVDSNVEKIVIRGTKYFNSFSNVISGTNITSVEIQGSSINVLGGDAGGDNLFMDCPKLTSLDLSNTSIVTIGGMNNSCCPFAGSYIKTLTLPKGLKTLGQNALADGGQNSGKGTYGSATDGIETIVIPSGVTSIGQNCFMNLKGLKTVCVPSSVSSFNNSQLNMGYGTGSTSQTEIVVYGQDSLDDPGWVTTLKSQWRGTRTAMQNVQFAYPGGVIVKAKELSDALAADPTGVGISASDVLDLDAAYGLLAFSQVTAAGYSISEADWNGIATTVDTAWKAVLGSADASSMSASEKLAQVSEYLAKKQAAYEELVAEFEKAKADLSAARKAYIAANEVATSVTSMKANYERQLKEAQAKVDEAQAKVEELENLLDPDAVAANKAKIISLQDKLAISTIGGGSKVVKLNKKGKTKAKATVKLKLVKSESGAAVACAKAKGTSKNVTVSDNGVLTLKKGVKKGTYKAKVKLTCGNATKTITYTFKAA